LINSTASIPLQIRKIIYEKFNDTSLRFTNDKIFETLKGNIEQSLTIDDMAPFFKQLHNDGLLRPIAQDFTTQWYKLFAEVEKFKCNSCNLEIHLGKLEPRVCPNSECKAPI
jgi:hypothetical protein